MMFKFKGLLLVSLISCSSAYALSTAEFSDNVDSAQDQRQQMQQQRMDNRDQIQQQNQERRDQRQQQRPRR